jgi:hypothetical protein
VGRRGCALGAAAGGVCERYRSRPGHHRSRPGRHRSLRRIRSQRCPDRYVLEPSSAWLHGYAVQSCQSCTLLYTPPVVFAPRPALASRLHASRCVPLDSRVEGRHRARRMSPLWLGCNWLTFLIRSARRFHQYSRHRRTVLSRPARTPTHHFSEFDTRDAERWLWVSTPPHLYFSG